MTERKNITEEEWPKEIVKEILSVTKEEEQKTNKEY